MHQSTALTTKREHAHALYRKINQFIAQPNFWGNRMSNIGNKAMKKTLERLKDTSKDDIRSYLDFIKTMCNLLREEKSIAPKNNAILYLMSQSGTTIRSLTLYIQALEEYCNESDEEWDKIMKKAEELKNKQEQTKQKQTETLKGDPKKTGKYVA